jgi:acyl-CoA thioester hydrolase
VDKPDRQAGGKSSSAGEDYIDFPVRVRYADTDTAGIVYYGTYPVYFEVGRAEYMRTKGFTYREFQDMGYHLVVVSMEAKYHSSAVYDDLLVVRTSIAELKSRSLTFHYKIYQDKTLVVEGKTKHICLNSSKKPALIPSRLFEVLKDVQS